MFNKAKNFMGLIQGEKYDKAVHASPKSQGSIILPVAGAIGTVAAIITGAYAVDHHDDRVRKAVIQDEQRAQLELSEGSHHGAKIQALLHEKAELERHLTFAQRAGQNTKNERERIASIDAEIARLSTSRKLEALERERMRVTTEMELFQARGGDTDDVRAQHLAQLDQEIAAEKASLLRSE